VKESYLLQSLVEYTGNLRPASSTSNGELNDLRMAFAASVRGGQSATDIGSLASAAPVPDAVRQDLEYFAARV